MNLQKGGKLIAQGSYGCVFRPALKCSDESKRPDGVVSKLIKTSEAKKEIAENKIINKIDDTNIYHLPPPKLCKAESYHFSESGISGCNVIRGRSQKHFSVLQYKDGGMELRDFLEKAKVNKFFSSEKNIKNFIFSMYNLFVGLDDMYKNNFIHCDIKTQNIVYDPDKIKFNFIDFGLAGKLDKILTQKSYESRWMFGYFCYPYEVFLLNNNYYRSVKTRNSVYFPTQLNFLYNRSYAKTIDNYVFYNGSIYKPTWEDLDIVKTYEKLTNELSRNELSREIIKKIDVFSMGIVLAEVLWVIRNTRINASQITSSTNILFRNLHSLVLNMVNPLYTTRFNATQVLEYYEKNIMPLVTDVIPVLKEPVALKSIPKPPELTEIIEKKESKVRKKCPEDKILNPKTGRCVNKTGVMGKKLLKELKSVMIEERKPSTKKISIKQVSHKKTQKKCPEDKILNPKTGRCVNKTGIMGKKLLKELKPVMIEEIKSTIKPIKIKKTKKKLLLRDSKSKTKTQKKCSEGKILNPKTGRCVSKTGVTGKKINK
jgi:serine/threonine protein kinase